MKYEAVVRLKNGTQAYLRNGIPEDGQELLEVFNKTHEETEFLLSYPDETSFDCAQEAEFLRKKMEGSREIEILAFVGDKIAGSAGFEVIGSCEKTRHRADLGISILKEYWGLGIGKALIAACIECARRAGFQQLELEVVGENASAIALYKKAGFVECGRNPKGFRLRSGEFQELIHMRLELDCTE